MGMLENAVGVLGKKLDKTPGFGYVVALVSTILGIVLNSVAPESSWSVALLALAGSFVAYWFGGFLDDLLFEPIYGLPPELDPSNAFGRFLQRRFVKPIRRLAHKGTLATDMINARAKAAKRFHPTNQRGIYKTAKKLLSNTELWDGRIKLWLDLSKATRTLIIPTVFLLGFQLLAVSTDWPATAFLDKYDEIAAWLWNPILTTFIAVVLIVLYVNLRLRHMRLLYKTVAERPAFRFVVDILEPSTDSRSSEVLWSVGDRVISERELPVCETASMEKEQSNNKPLQPCAARELEADSKRL
jgi:hypothetical protein